MQKIAQGAEAILYKDNESIYKIRPQKPYRQKELDEKIRLQRTRREAKLLAKAQEIIHCPKVIQVDEKKARIEMEYIQGKNSRNIRRK